MAWWALQSCGLTPERERVSSSENVASSSDTNQERCRRLLEAVDSDSWALSPTGKTPDAEKIHKKPKRNFSLGVKKRGRIRRELKYPAIVENLKNFVQQNSYQAHSRRHSTTGLCGVRLSDMRQNLLKTVPGLSDEGISLSTVQRFMFAPHRRCSASKLYRGSVGAKVAAKSNKKRLSHVDAQYYSSRVKYVREFSAAFAEECLELSCDNKNKIKIGVVATDRRIKIRKFFMENDAPDFPDHDFPLRGMKFTPNGYMVLQRKPDQPEFAYDDLGRKHYFTPKTGTLYVVNRAEGFQSATIQAHVNDLIKILPNLLDSKTMLTLVVDNGPDWRSSSLLNCLFYVRLWKELNLDFMFVVSYAPKHSALNPIEHSWSVCTNALTAVTLPATLPGESLPPCQQNLPQHLLKRKEALILDTAMSHTCEYWKRQCYDGFPIKPSYEHCTAKSIPFNDHSVIKDTLKSAVQTRQNLALYAELKFMLCHLDRRIDTVVIKKCTEATCEYCSSHPLMAKKAAEFLSRNPDFPSPQFEGSIFDGHYLSYMQRHENNSSPQPQTDPDYRLPSKDKKRTGRCALCSGYTFTSESDRRKHYSLFHNKCIDFGSISLQPSSTNVSAGASGSSTTGSSSSSGGGGRGGNSMLDLEPSAVRDMFLADPHSLALLRERNPDLADALTSGNIAQFAEVLTKQRKEHMERERLRMRAMTADPFDPDAQKYIEEAIQQENINSMLEHAMEHAPEVFAHVTMLYVQVKVNNHPIKAFVDSGAQSTIMSSQCAERCNILRLVDKRFSGIAQGVGTQKIIGKIHLAQMQIEGDYLPTSFIILEDQPMDVLLGLDMLKRHQCILDLQHNVLKIGTTGTETNFLGESELPESARLSHGAMAGGRSPARPSVSPGPGPASPPKVARQEPSGGAGPDAASVDQLVSMGFGKDQATQALRQTNGDTNNAIALLLAQSLKGPS